MDEKVVKVEITHKTIVFAVFLLIGIFLLYLVKDIIILFIVSLLLMAALNPIVSSLENLKVPRALSIAITYIVFYGVIFLSIALLLPPLVSQATQLLSGLTIPPKVIESLDINTIDLQQLQVLATQISSVPKLLNIVFSAFTAVFVVFTVSVMTFYLLLGRKDLHKNLIWMFGNNHSEKKAESFINDLENKIGSWFRAQGILMFVVGSLTYIGLLLLGIDYALPLAILAGFLEIVPNLGPTLAAVPAVAFTYFSLSPTLALFVLLLYVGIQQVENNLLVPIVMRHNVGINPIATILLLLIGFRLGSVIGTILSIPLYIVLKVIIQEALRYRRAQS